MFFAYMALGIFLFFFLSMFLFQISMIISKQVSEEHYNILSKYKWILLLSSVSGTEELMITQIPVAHH